MFYNYAQWYNGVPNANTVRITQNPSECYCGNVIPFDETYSIHLQGYMSQDEWRDCITQVNIAMRKGSIWFKLSMIFTFLLIGGFIAAAVITFTSSHFLWQLWIGAIVGLVVCQFFPMILCCIGRSEALKALQVVVSDINNRYRDRGMQWRTAWQRVGYGKSSRVFYYIDIELARAIGSPIQPMMIATPPPYDMPSNPPPYTPSFAPPGPITSEGGFCGKCGHQLVVGDTFCRQCGAPN